MYKKAGIVIAIVMVILAIVILNISSCSTGGIQLNELSGDGVQSSVVPESSEVDVASLVESTGGVGSVSIESTSEASFDNNVSVTQPEQVVSTAESSLDIGSHGEESQVVSESSNGVSNSTYDDDTKKFIQINKNSIKYDYNDKTIGGSVKDTEMYYSQSDSSLYTSVLLLGEDGNIYTYFVPYTTFSTLTVGTKVSMEVRYYYDEGVAIHQVLSVSIAE